FFMSNGRGKGPIRRHQTASKQIGAGYYSKGTKTVKRCPDVRQGIRRRSHLIAKGFGRKIVAGPGGRIAAPGVTGDALAGRRTEDRIDNRAIRHMALLNGIRYRYSVRFRAFCRGSRQRKNDQEHDGRAFEIHRITLVRSDWENGVYAVAG